MMTIKIKRVYEPCSKEDGARFLVERLWPRGIRKEALQMDAWCKEIAPSNSLRRWFNHDPAKWEEFRRRYLIELGDNPAGCQPLLETTAQRNLTLLYAARDTAHNSALVLKAHLEMELRSRKDSLR